MEVLVRGDSCPACGKKMGRRVTVRSEVSKKLRFDVLERDHFRCVYCGMAAGSGAVLHIDHVVAAKSGGAATLENLVASCRDCNLGKGDRKWRSL